ncbi:hypothetical protein [uncultured Kordia sp.]|uniref:hypothetical protein n=1 Tax=uncultured Kordia sp. TaxID=507699 RepID=UPI002627A1B1|nr:hypothetical protein [uncultured Kordia sp.]
MAKLYVFGIGGTGARVIKSLTMLLATGVTTNYDIVPILIDPDSASGDLNKTIKLLRDYQNIQKQTEEYEPNLFFKNKISTLTDVVVEKGSSVKVVDGFRFELDGVQNYRFKDFIDFNSLDQNNKNLTKLLFSEKNLDAELEVGFKGHPNIGSVVLNQFSKSEVFQSFADSFQEEDRIFIISSIFGGTGAAGFPLLLKNIRKGIVGGKHYAHLKDARIGAISIQPYFKVKQDESSEIDSHSFITKTKAALHYYSRNITGNKSINALYYIGDTVDNPYENIEGGTKQKNDAHFIEVASALSVIDFASIDDTQLETIKETATYPVYKEFGVMADGQINLNTLYESTREILLSNLTSYFYFNLFLKEKLNWAISKSYPFTEDATAKIDSNFTHQSFYKTLSNFNLEYRIWLAQLQRNQVSFTPFEIEPVINQYNEVTDFKVNTKSIFTLVRNIPERKGINPFAQNNYELFVDHLNKASHKLGNAPNTPKRFMGVFSQGIKTLVDKKLL